ncbi:unnamed protein product, partial [Candidula unifasciata]
MAAPPGVALYELLIWMLPYERNNYLFLIQPLAKLTIPGRRYHSRLSVTINTTGELTTSTAVLITMRISNLQCYDEGVYACVFGVATEGAPAVVYNLTMPLNLQNAHEPPVVTLKPKNLHPVEKYYFAYEGVTVTVSCSADLGWHGTGRLEWRIQQGDRVKIVEQGDLRLKPQIPDLTSKGDLNCTRYVKQSFQLSAGAGRQATILACFVVNSLYANKTRHFCTNADADMCRQSPAIWF